MEVIAQLTQFSFPHFLPSLTVETMTLLITCCMFFIYFGYIHHCEAREFVPYCPFYNNRGISPQPFLENCTWYKENACCQQIEIKQGFANVKPPQGASPQCLQQLNYLMCYICDPTQYLFYQNEYLTVCLDFCDNLYNACKDATLKGSVISQLYPSGEEFCKSRRFRVKKREESGDCFYYGDLQQNSQATGISGTLILSLLLYLLTYLG